MGATRLVRRVEDALGVPRSKATKGLGALSRREEQVVRYIAMGLRNAEVARELSISEETVKTHLNRIFRKLGVRDRLELALYAARAGIVTGDRRD